MRQLDLGEINDVVGGAICKCYVSDFPQSFGGFSPIETRGFNWYGSASDCKKECCSGKVKDERGYERGPFVKWRYYGSSDYKHDSGYCKK